MFFPDRDQAIVICNERVKEKIEFIGYTTFQPPFDCILETSDYNFDSRMGHENLTIVYKKSFSAKFPEKEFVSIDMMNDFNNTITEQKDHLYEKLQEQLDNMENSFGFIPDTAQCILIIFAILFFFSLLISMVSVWKKLKNYTLLSC